MAAALDFFAYPPTSFPLRDLLVLHHVALGPSDVVCEIGVGSGGTSVRLAKRSRRVVGFEISEPVVKALGYLEQRHPNLRFVHADITRPEDTESHRGAFTRAVACDTLEHVEDPRAFFEAIARLLAPGGTFFVTFPNEPKDKMHGITRFDTPQELQALVTQAGLEVTQLGGAKLSHWADAVAKNLAWRPLRATRKVLRRRPRGAAAAPPPQKFEDTHFMKQMSGWKKLSPLVNLYWHGVLNLMETRGPSFEIDDGFRETPFTECQVLIAGRKPLTG
jgi:SAM-dependent methyltransferase